MIPVESDHTITNTSNLSTDRYVVPEERGIRPTFLCNNFEKVFVEFVTRKRNISNTSRGKRVCLQKKKLFLLVSFESPPPPPTFQLSGDNPVHLQNFPHLKDAGLLTEKTPVPTFRFAPTPLTEVRNICYTGEEHSSF